MVGSAFFMHIFFLGSSSWMSNIGISIFAEMHYLLHVRLKRSPLEQFAVYTLLRSDSFLLPDMPENEHLFDILDGFSFLVKNLPIRLRLFHSVCNHRVNFVTSQSHFRSLVLKEERPLLLNPPNTPMNGFLLSFPIQFFI